MSRKREQRSSCPTRSMSQTLANFPYAKQQPSNEFCSHLKQFSYQSLRHPYTKGHMLRCGCNVLKAQTYSQQEEQTILSKFLETLLPL
ncbi:hypothetical protein STEG23_036144 [Scotinomys teguina]